MAVGTILFHSGHQIVVTRVSPISQILSGSKLYMSMTVFFNLFCITDHFMQ